MNVVRFFTTPGSPNPNDYKDIYFWVDPEREGWLSKQGEYFRSWRRRWFVLKQGRLFWFMHPNDVTNTAVPRGVVRLDQCQDVKSAEEAIKRPNSLVIYIGNWPIYYVADTHREKDEWINSITRAMVQNSDVSTPEIPDYGQSSR